MNCKREIKTLINSFIILIICIFIGSVLVTVANYIPVDEKMKKDIISQMEAEGLFPLALDSSGSESGFHSIHPGTLELATDRLMVKMSLYDGEYSGYKQAFYNIDEQLSQGEYSRYWHGYVVILRPLFHIFDYDSLKYLNAIAQLLLIVLISVEIRRKLSLAYVLAFISSVILLVPWATAMCFQYSWVLYSYFFTLLFLLYKSEYFLAEERMLYLFTVSGALTIFLDLMTFPLVVWGCLAIWWIVLCEKNKTALSYLKKVVFSGIYWLIGYVGMWLGKLTVGSLILRMNLFEHAYSEMQFWTQNSGSRLEKITEAISTNWKPYEYPCLSLVLIVWGATFVIVILKKGFSSSSKIPSFLLIASSSFVWYVVMSSHAIMHHIFTFRTFEVCILAVFAIVLEQYCYSGARVISGMSLPVILTLLITCFVSFLLMNRIRDNYEYHNGGSEFFEYTFSDNIVQVSFVPRFDHVSGLYVGLNSDIEDTFFSVKIVDDENTLISEEQCIISESDDVFCKIGNELNLNRGRRYYLTLIPGNTEDKMFVTTEKNYDVSEIGTVIVNGVDSGCYPLFKVDYYGGLDTVSKKLLYTLSIQSVFLMLLSLMFVMIHKRNKLLN